MSNIIRQLDRDELIAKFVQPKCVRMKFMELAVTAFMSLRVFQYENEDKKFYGKEVLISAIEIMKDDPDKHVRVEKFKTFISYLEYTTDLPTKDGVLFSNAIIPQYSIGMIDVKKFNQFLHDKYLITLSKEEIVSYVSIKNIIFCKKRFVDHPYFSGNLYEIQNFEKQIGVNDGSNLIRHKDGSKSMRKLFDKYPNHMFFDPLGSIIESDIKFLDDPKYVSFPNFRDK